MGVGAAILIDDWLALLLFESSPLFYINSRHVQFRFIYKVRATNGKLFSMYLMIRNIFLTFFNRFLTRQKTT
jgi:hypothetical protein